MYTFPEEEKRKPMTGFKPRFRRSDITSAQSPNQLRHACLLRYRATAIFDAAARCLKYQNKQILATLSPKLKKNRLLKKIDTFSRKSLFLVARKSRQSRACNRGLSNGGELTNVKYKYPNVALCT